VLLFCFVGCAHAELSITTLDRIPPDARALSLSETPDGKILLHAGGVDMAAMSAGQPGSLPFAPWRHWFYTLAPDGQLLRRVELSSPDFRSIVPFGEGFTAVRISPARPCPPPCSRSPWLHQIVALESAAQRDRRLIYQATDDVHELQLFTGAGMQDLYALERHTDAVTVPTIPVDACVGKAPCQSEWTVKSCTPRPAS